MWLNLPQLVAFFWGKLIHALGGRGKLIQVVGIVINYSIVGTSLTAFSL